MHNITCKVINVFQSFKMKLILNIFIKLEKNVKIIYAIIQKESLMFIYYSKTLITPKLSILYNL